MRTVTISALELTALDGSTFSPDDLDLGTKHAGETISVTVDFTQALAAGDVLLAASVAVSPALPGGISASASTTVGATADFALSGGVSGATYTITVTVVSLMGETLQPVLTMEVA